MADEENMETPPNPGMTNVVSALTAQALREMDTGDMEPGTPHGEHQSDGGSHPASPAGSKSGSRKGSARPGSASAGSRPPSAARSNPSGSRPTSAAKSIGSKKGSRPTSAARSATGSPQTGHDLGGLEVTGSRPGSATQAPGSRPGSAEAPGSRPGSAQAPGSRPGSAQAPGSRPASAQAPGSRPGSAQAPGSRAGSAQATRSPIGLQQAKGSNHSSRPGSAKTGTANRSVSARSGEKTPERPGSAAQRPPSGASKDGRPASSAQRPASGAERPPSAGQRPASGEQRPSSGTQRPASAQRSPIGDQRPASGAAEQWPGKQSAEQERPGSQAGSIRVKSGGQLPPDEEDQNPAPGPLAPSNTQDDDLLAPLDAPLAEVVGDDRPQHFGGRGGGGGGGGGGDDFNDDYALDENDEEEIEDEESDEEMVVLDPDHPLMIRFQRAMKDHLDKQNEKVTLEYKELLASVKTRTKNREDLGVELYGIQQELARHQMLLENYHDKFAMCKQDRVTNEQTLADTRSNYKKTQNNNTEQHRRGAELQSEVENLALRVFIAETAKEDVRSDISVMKRAAEKAESVMNNSELEKQRQDLYVDMLVEKVDRLREEIAMYEAQLSAQSEETKATKETLNEAYMEIDTINLEKKQLYQQWNSSLIGMRRRDEAHAAMMEALNEQQQRILTLMTEIEGYKRSIQKEQEQNEKLVRIHSNAESDMATVKRQFAQCIAKHNALKIEYATFTRMLHETEQALNRANTEKSLKHNELTALRKQIEREYAEKVRLEDEILEKTRSQLTMNKAATYTSKLTGKLRTNTKNLESQVATVENQISSETLELSNTMMRIERLDRIVSELNDEIAQKNNIVSRCEAEMVKRNAIIERKQGVIDQYNKKLEHMITSAGGVEIGPLEIQINSMQKSIDAEKAAIIELQQMWLRDQSELVRLMQDQESATRDVNNLKKQFTILFQKKLRIEGNISGQQQEVRTLERNINNIQNAMLKLNTLVYKEKGLEHDLQKGNILKENDFIGGLREAEGESVEMQENLNSMSEEKERLLNSLVEAERQIMLWEKKTQLANETRQAVDSELGQGEIRAMKAEIHRMQVRYTQLMKQQEIMIQNMEKAVGRRDTIVTRGDAQSKMNKKVLTKGTFQRQMGELKKKIKTTINDANECDADIRELRTHQRDLSSQLEDKQLSSQQLQSNADALDSDMERLYEHKQKNMSDLISKQQKAKYYQQVKDKKYVRLCKSATSLETEREKQVDRTQTLAAIVDRLNQEYPHAQTALYKVTNALSARTVQ